MLRESELQDCVRLEKIKLYANHFKSSGHKILIYENAFSI